MTTTQVGNGIRNDRTRKAIHWLGQALAFYVAGDSSHDDMARELATATWSALDDDFGPAVRRLDVALALKSLSEALAEEVPVQIGIARGEGATWEQVGKAVGTTRQAAQMRYGS